MTNEEAIKELKESHDIMRSYDVDESESRLMIALDMAIKALEQGPCEDAISRSEAIMAIEEKAKRIKNEDTLNGLAGAVAILFNLPSYNSINSELSDDAVSRQAVLDIDFNRIIHTTAKPAEMIKQKVEQLPSVKPQESSITWVTGADGAKIAFWDVPVWKVTKICEILGEPQERNEE